jgi:Ser/Thr protein kinase RdoA (MazF antagonist)
MFEGRTEIADLPFFLGLLDHLADKGCPVPRTIHDRDGASFRSLTGPDGEEKVVALIEFLPGVSVSLPTPAQAHAVGIALAQMHKAVEGYDQNRRNTLALPEWRDLLEACGRRAGHHRPRAGRDRHGNWTSSTRTGRAICRRRRPCRPLPRQCADAGRDRHRPHRLLFRLHRHHRL